MNHQRRPSLWLENCIFLLLLIVEHAFTFSLPFVFLLMRNACHAFCVFPFLFCVVLVGIDF